MNFLASPIGVIAILAIVAIAAVMYEPAKYVGVWRELAKLYEADKQPISITFKGESIKVGRLDYSQVDIALNDDGFWILHVGSSPQKAPACIQVPWDCVRYRQEKRGRQNFQIRGKKPIELWVMPELGAVMQRRSERYTLEDELG
jgi:hypothetical protein|tara:strand:+ start:23 stop:457 length:435 start_codon:yes stop_codon:yes gene_type:complete